MRDECRIDFAFVRNEILVSVFVSLCFEMAAVALFLLLFSLKCGRKRNANDLKRFRLNQ